MSSISLNVAESISVLQIRGLVQPFDKCVDIDYPTVDRVLHLVKEKSHKMARMSKTTGQGCPLTVWVSDRTKAAIQKEADRIKTTSSKIARRVLENWERAEQEFHS